MGNLANSKVLTGLHDNEIKLAMEDYDLPEGFSYKFTGEQEEQAEEQEEQIP